MRRISAELEAKEPDVSGVLQHSLLEASGGFASNRFPARDAARQLMNQIDAGKEQFSSADIALLMSALEFSLAELGEEEFETISGYDFSFGTSTLAELKKLAKELG